MTAASRAGKDISSTPTAPGNDPDGGRFVLRAGVLDAADLRRAHTRIAHEIVERNHGAEGVVLVGLYTRGLVMARRLATAIEEFEHVAVPVGALDVAFYRDDIGIRAVQPLGPTEIPVDIAGKVVVLVDDVLYTGRTVRAALDALTELGRPTRGAARDPRRPRTPGAADPPRFRGQEPPHPPRRGRARAPGGDRRRARFGRALGRAAGRGRAGVRSRRWGMKHLLSIADLDRRVARGAARALRALPRGHPARHPEGPGAAGQGRGVALLRRLHPHPHLVRDRGEAPLVRRHELLDRELVGPEGREPARHRADHRGDGHRRGRHPPSRRRRAPPRRVVGRRQRGERGRRLSRAPHAGAARRAHPAPPSRRRSQRRAHRHRRRHPALAGRAEQRGRVRDARRDGHAGADRPRCCRRRSRAGRSR